MPDYFAVKVDGVEVEPRIVPTDVLVSGTTYAWAYWGATPRDSHTYEVEAVVVSGGATHHSSGNATTTYTTNPTGIWLIDDDDGTYVRVAGTENLQLALGELGTTYTLAGGRAPVRITDTVRGYEGTITGSLLSKADRDTFLTLKGRLKPLRLVVSDLAIQVMLEEASAPPSALPNDRLYGVSFGVVQVDDFTFSVR
jgi:hypothetical protein